MNSISLHMPEMQEDKQLAALSQAPEWAWQSDGGYVVLSKPDRQLQCVLSSAGMGNWGTREPERGLGTQP